MDNYSVKEVMFRMSDGIELYTRFFTPGPENKKYPIVYFRTPYEYLPDNAPYKPNVDEQHFSEHGYAIVTQHCRGRGRSEGEFHAYKNERKDGLETLEMIRKLPFYNSEIYLYGGSYTSTVHYSYLSEPQPDIKGAVLAIQTDRPYFREFKNGCSNNYGNMDWWFFMLKDRRYPNQNWDNAIRRPYKDIAKRVLGEDDPEYTEKLMHNEYDDFWKNDPRTDVVDKLSFPVLLWTGFYDFFVEGMFSMWERFPEKLRKTSAMCVGPFAHEFVPNPDYPYKTPNGFVPLNPADWFDMIRSGKTTDKIELGKVNYYSLGSDKWCSSDYPAESEKVRLWFNDDGMMHKFAAQSGEITYKYDPDNMHNCFPFYKIVKAFEPGTVDGVVSFISESFDEDTDVFGKIKWHMTVKSDCEDTAFFMRVYLVEDGEAYNLTETLTALSYFYPDYLPGTPVVLDLETSPSAFTVRKGCKIRADISSECGTYVPHANVRGHFALVEESRIAHNTLLLENSYLELPKHI